MSVVAQQVQHFGRTPPGTSMHVLPVLRRALLGRGPPLPASRRMRVVSTRLSPSWPCPHGIQALRTYATRPFPSSRSPTTTTDPTATDPPVLARAPDYALYPNDIHCFLGLNGSGKSRLLQALQDTAQQALTDTPTGRRVRVGTLSFDAHRAMVRTHGDRVVADVLGGIASPDARDLIVRLGLYPVWDSPVRVLSTGEMRKLLLAAALLRVPRSTVLVLDQPFDGLDTKARAQLTWMLGQLTRGFTRLLVETGARNEAFAYKTQVLLVANRLDHVLPEILSHVVLTKKDRDVETRPWTDTEDPDAMLDQLRAFLETEAEAQRDEAHTSLSVSDETLASLVERLYTNAVSSDNVDTSLALELKQVSVAYGRRLLLADLNFERARHQHWALLGPNGSGKSSLMRVLTQSDGHGMVAGDVVVHGDRIAVVSTDQHMEMVENDAFADKTASQWLHEAAGDDSGVVETVVQLLGVSRALLPRPFSELSQGEQKLVQIATAVAQRPHVLILDEITHGLDVFNRARVLRVVNAIGRVAAHHTHLILITHHEDEIVACFEDVFVIDDQTLHRVERAQ